MSNYIVLFACAVAFVFFGVWAKRLTDRINWVFEMLLYDNPQHIRDKEKLAVELRACKQRLSAVTKRHQRPKKNKTNIRG